MMEALLHPSLPYRYIDISLHMLQGFGTRAPRDPHGLPWLLASQMKVRLNVGNEVETNRSFTLIGHSPFPRPQKRSWLSGDAEELSFIDVPPIEHLSGHEAKIFDSTSTRPAQTRATSTPNCSLQQK